MLRVEDHIIGSGLRDWINLRVLFSLENCWIHPISNGFWSICPSHVFHIFQRSDQVVFSFYERNIFGLVHKQTDVMEKQLELL